MLFLTDRLIGKRFTVSAVLIYQYTPVLHSSALPQLWQWLARSSTKRTISRRRGMIWAWSKTGRCSTTIRRMVRWFHWRKRLWRTSTLARLSCKHKFVCQEFALHMTKCCAIVVLLPTLARVSLLYWEYIQRSRQKELTSQWPWIWMPRDLTLITKNCCLTPSDLLL